MESIRHKIFGTQYDPYDGFVPMESDLQGWNSNSPVFDMCISELKPKLIIEVGSWKGASAVHMANVSRQYHDNFHIICIDTFLGSVEHWGGLDPHLPLSKIKNGRPIIYEQFMSNVVLAGLSNHITALPMDSVNAGLFLQKIGIKADMVYIDAGHEYDSVKADLRIYKDLLNDGGYLLGDDWFYAPIKRAVSYVLGESVITMSPDKFLWKK